MAENILVVDDEREIADLVEVYLQNEGYTVYKFYNAGDALNCLETTPISLAVLDIMLPDRDGLSLVKDLREHPETASIPVIMVTAKSSEMDKVKGLDQGADDYMTKPFGVMELISRVKAMLRRANLSVETSLEFEGIVLNDAKHKVTVDGKQCDLTYKEFELLKYLMQNWGIVLQRGRILDRVWGIDYEGESRTLDMHIKTLRKKLGDKGALVQTVRNVGYTLNYKKEK